MCHENDIGTTQKTSPLYDLSAVRRVVLRPLNGLQKYLLLPNIFLQFPSALFHPKSPNHDSQACREEFLLLLNSTPTSASRNPISQENFCGALQFCLRSLYLIQKSTMNMVIKWTWGNKAPAIPQNMVIKWTKDRWPRVKWGSPNQLGKECNAIADQCRLLWNHLHPLKMQRPRQKGR